MTYVKDVFGRDMFKDFDKLYVGFEDQYNRLSKVHSDLSKQITNYPPYNIRKLDENRYAIEIAVAGFSKSEIEIEFIDDKLIIKGNAKDDSDSENNWLYKGISTRNFTRTFMINDTIEIKGASLANGLLKIALEKIIPEHKKSTKIDIKDDSDVTSSSTKSNKMFLSEQDDVNL